MGFNIRPQSYAEQAGGNLRNFSEQLADGVQDFACQLWGNFPAFISGNKSLPISFVRGYFSTMCDPATLPAPLAPPPFSGGQCPERYKLFYQNAVISNGTLAGWSSTFSVNPVNLVGPITNIILLVNNVADEDLEHWSFDGQGEEPFINERTKQYKFRCTTPNGDVDVAIGNTFGRRFVDLQKNSGLPDDCGSPPPAPYPDNPPDPGAGDFNTTIDIKDNQGNDFNFPLVYAPVDFNFPMNFDLGGVEVILDIGGIQFNGGDNNYPGGGGNDLPDGQPDPVATDAPDDGGRTLIPPPTPELDENLDTEELPESQSEEEEEIERLKYVKLELLEIPQGKGVQWGGGSAPNVYIAGWFEFKAGNFCYPRQPVHFTKNIYVAPEGANGFAYTLDIGILGKATIFKVKE